MKKIEVTEKEINTLKYFIENTKNSHHKAGLYTAFCKGLIRKMEEAKND